MRLTTSVESSNAMTDDETPMRTSTSLRASTSMAVHPSIGSGIAIQPTLAKYAKIQPAIAIKPKPTAAAPVKKSSFNPRYDPTTSTSLLQEEANINTLRKWVLPPRPRPGRKPTAPPTTPVPEERKTTKKKKVQKLEKEDTVSTTVTGIANGVAITTNPSVGATNASTVPSTKTNLASTAVKDGETLIASRPLQPASQQVGELQASYLARLKEQELIRNYMEVLTNQIKELKFVQSGVITSDALNERSKPSVPILLSEKLAHINNIHDLDTFLAHLTTQSNVIHLVTKKFVGDQSLGGRVQLQILHYLELRASHRGATNNDRPFTLPRLAMTRNQPSSQSFTPSLLRPLKLNFFDDDEVIDVDLINDGDSFLDQTGFLERLRFDEPNNGLLNDEKPVDKKMKKMGCGFCNADTPCVCFDADSIFGEPK